ncbi:hypothetical protein [Paenibacillus faecalis]|uniref:hypothetical protein n=1 Tax=Paenibacillus faecalis TaxID=2079532 RepID=UPI000D0E7A9C|nr:hypothetical protein [Paenibacillus faecalis]
MYKSKKTYAVLLLSAALLCQSASFEVYGAPAVASASKSAPAMFTLDKLGSVTLKRNVSVKLTNMDVLSQPGGSILVYTLQYSNRSGSRVDLMDYFSKVTLPSGSSVKGKVITSDAKKRTVPANSNLTVTYYANIGKASSLSGVKLSVFGWDFSGADYQKKLGTFKIPAKYSSIVPKGKSKKVVINNLPVMAKATSLQRMKRGGKMYMRVGVNFSNRGKKALNDPGFKAYLKSAGGSVYELVPEDDAKSRFNIQPGQQRTLYYVAEVPLKVKTNNMMLQFTQDDEALNITLPVITFKLPAVTSIQPVADHAVKKIYEGHHAIETQLKHTSVYAENDIGKWSLQFRIKNLGDKSVKLPAYEASIQTSEGYSIPVDAKALSNVTLKPMEERLIELGAEIPLTMQQNELQLQLMKPAEEGKVRFPTALYKIPYTEEGRNYVGIENQIENRHGTFGVKLGSYQRLPWGDKDQIAARISLRNTKGSTVQLPELKAIVKAGMRDLSGTAQIVNPNDQTTLAPNETAELYVLAQIPYSYDFRQLRIELQEVSGEETEKFLALSTTALNNVMKQVDAADSYSIQTPGKKAEVRERLSTVYKDSSSHLIYTELEMTSQEKRQSSQAQLVAYYKTPDDQYFEAKVNQSSDRTSPNGKNLVTVWSKIPMNVNPSQLVLYVGEGVAEGRLTAPGEASTGSINTVGLALSPKVIQPAKNLQHVEMFPYRLSITRGESFLSEGKDMIDIVLHYNLSRNSDYEMGPYEHKLILEIVDPTGQSTVKMLTPGTDLTIGGNNTYAVTMNGNFRKLNSGGGIRINLYDEFQGRRMLLGSQSYPLVYEQPREE